MSHELFEIKTKPDLNADEISRYNNLIQKSSTARNLGLLAQVALIERQAHNLKRSCLLTTTPLSSEEVTIWQSWLPIRFSTDENSMFPHVGTYAYETIVSSILTKWNDLRDQRIFESFEIWTRSDARESLLVGVNGSNCYLVARWNCSVGSLLSFEKVKSELYSAWLKNLKFSGDQKYPWFDPRRYNHPDVIFGSVAFAFVLPILFEYDILLPPYTMDTLSSLVLSLGLGFVSFVISRRRMINRLRLESPLMQAIMTNDGLKKVDTFDLEPKSSWFSWRKKKEKPYDPFHDLSVFDRPHTV